MWHLKAFKWLGIGVGGLVLALALLLGYWFWRPNGAVVAPALVMDTWDVVNDGEHNSNTDLIDWQGAFYLIHASSPVHFASAGGTSYPGVVRRGGDLYVSYYTSPIDQDYPWILGMMLPSSIRLARIDLASLEALAQTHVEE